MNALVVPYLYILVTWLCCILFIIYLFFLGESLEKSIKDGKDGKRRKDGKTALNEKG
jgi:hypothetical protein